MEISIFGNFLQKYNINNFNEFENIQIYKNDYETFKKNLEENLQSQKNVLEWKMKRLAQCKCVLRI